MLKEWFITHKKMQTILTRSSLFKRTFSSHSSQLPLDILKPYHYGNNQFTADFFALLLLNHACVRNLEYSATSLLNKNRFPGAREVSREQIKPVLSGTVLLGRSVF